MDNPNTTDLITPEQPVEIQKVLDALPGLVGAIDQAIIDQSGKRLAFVLVIFNEGGAMHATNIQPVSDAVKAVKELAAVWDAQEEGDGLAVEGIGGA